MLTLTKSPLFFRSFFGFTTLPSLSSTVRMAFSIPLLSFPEKPLVPIHSSFFLLIVD
jgi:hypothetical protein